MRPRRQSEARDGGPERAGEAAQGGSQDAPAARPGTPPGRPRTRPLVLTVCASRRPRPQVACAMTSFRSTRSVRKESGECCMQQPTSSTSAPSGGTAFYDAREEVIRFVLGRQTVEALQGWTITGEPGNISMNRALTVDELMALSESGLVRSSSEDESMSDDGSSSDEDESPAFPLPSPTYSPTPSSDSEEPPQHEQREGDVEIEIEIEAVGTLACPSCSILQPGLTVQPRDECYCGGGYCLRCGVDSCTCPWSGNTLSAPRLTHEEVQ